MIKPWRFLYPLFFISAFLVAACSVAACSVAKPAAQPSQKPPSAVARMVKICTFPNQMALYMNFNDITFASSPKPLLSRLVAITETNCEFSIAEIHGYTSSAGDADANMELSRRRAVAVQEWLGRQGYPADTAEIIAHGENDPFLKTGDDVREALNDRVEVLITGISHPPDTDPNRPPYDCPGCMKEQGYPIP